MLTRMAQRGLDFLGVMRAARAEAWRSWWGATIRRGLTSRSVPFSVFWFDDDHDRYGRMGVGVTSARHGTPGGGYGRPDGGIVYVKEAEDVDDPEVPD